MSTAIEWTEETWNPVVGCSKVSKGCDHCYAETVHATRLSGKHGYPTFRPWTPENAAHNVTLLPDRLGDPLRWRKPRLVFVNSMSDLFHELVPDDYIARVFAVMGAAREHTFQVLTKRPRRMSALLTDPDFERRVRRDAAVLVNGFIGLAAAPWPLPNVWLGTSLESWRFNYRADQLRRAPAAVHFISAEPLLDTLYPGTERDLDLSHIEWVIVGGESGHGARPMKPEWASEIRDHCVGTGRAFFFKQWGGRTPKAGGRELDGRTWDEMPTTTAAAA